MLLLYEEEEEGGYEICGGFEKEVYGLGGGGGGFDLGKGCVPVRIKYLITW